MTPERPSDFLTRLGKVLSAQRLYAVDHPTRERSLRDAFGCLRDLLARERPLLFTFLDGEVVFQSERLREMTDWPWIDPLTGIGVERIEIAAGVSYPEFVEFCSELGRRIGAGEAGFEEDLRALGHIRFGPLASSDVDVAELRRMLERERERLGDLFETARRERIIAPEAAGAVLDTIGSAIRQSRNLLELLIPLKEHTQYTTVHSMNVSVLSIGLAELTGYLGSDVRSIGEAALLHDVGKSLVPEAILDKTEPLTTEEWKLVRTHPTEGARILLRSGDDLRVPAIVAYEHHWRWDGGGYPERRHPREPHPATQLVQVCDVYDALRTDRPFRGSWSAREVLSHLKDRAGQSFSPDAVASLLALVRREELQEEEETRSEEDPIRERAPERERDGGRNRGPEPDADGIRDRRPERESGRIRDRRRERDEVRDRRRRRESDDG